MQNAFNWLRDVKISNYGRIKVSKFKENNSTIIKKYDYEMIYFSLN